MSAKRFLKLLVPQKWRSKLREHLVSINAAHLYGPEKIRLSSNEAIVTCIVKNGDFYIEQFIRHYSQMGFRHIFFLDNGSNDQTIKIAKEHKNVSVWQSDLPIEGNQMLFKKYLAQKSSEGGWCLDADIDEFFDFPFSSAIGLREFLEYLNKKQCTGVITQLLDMFSVEPLSHLATKKEENLTAVYQYYDISEIIKTKYSEAEIVLRCGAGNEILNNKAALYFGGIRKTLYGNDCLLTKHSLFLPCRGLELFPHVHFVNNAKLSDVSCVMYHYKLTSNALDTAIQNKGGFSGNSEGYGKFIDLIKKNPNYRIKQNTAVKFQNVSDLVENGFLFVSEDYREYVRALVKRESIVGPLIS